MHNYTPQPHYITPSPAISPFKHIPIQTPSDFPIPL